jgi:hypothetical protein
VGVMMPLWVTLFMRWAYGLPFRVESFILRGDFALYSAAFLAPTLYEIAARMKSEKSRLGLGAMILSTLGLLFSALIYTVLNPEMATNGVALQVHNAAGVIRLSLAMLFLAFLFAVCVFLNQQQLDPEDLANAELIDSNILSTKMDELGPQPTAAEPIAAPVEEPADTEAELKNKFVEDDNASGH